MQKVKNYYHFAQSFLAGLRFGFPARGLTVIGVTGTDGKTTTSALIYHLLHESGYKVAIISTIGAYINGKLIDTGFHVTTPTGFQLQRIIKKIRTEECTHLVLEVTSHALDQNRVFGIPFDIAVITNITHEHLDYHKTLEKYRNTKLKLLKKAPISILNGDDSSYEYLKNHLTGKKIITYSLNSQNADFSPKKAHLLEDDFNMSNQLAAIAAVSQISDKIQKNASEYLQTFKLPEGRQEYVYLDAFRIMVDFAHTPNALDRILSHIKKSSKGRIIHVFGSAGERDQTKRPLMGEATSRYSDVILLTSEDPRFEDPKKICEEIAHGIDKKFKKVVKLNNQSLNEYMIIIDRGKAIQAAISIARENDLIIVTGKGHEKSMNIQGKEYDWSDQKVILASV